jgi:hypothetical protein
MADRQEGEQPKPFDGDAQRVAEWVLGDPDAAQLLRGNTAEELLHDAHRVARKLAAIAANRKEKPPSPDFDGGVRQSVPLPGEPTREHDALALDVVRRAKWGLGPDDHDGWG